MTFSGIVVGAGQHEGDPSECPKCRAVAVEIEEAGPPVWTVEARPWPDGWPHLRRPYRLNREGVQVGVYATPGEAQAAVPQGDRVLQVTIEGHRRIVTKG